MELHSPSRAPTVFGAGHCPFLGLALGNHQLPDHLGQVRSDPRCRERVAEAVGSRAHSADSAAPHPPPCRAVLPETRPAVSRAPPSSSGADRLPLLHKTQLGRYRRHGSSGATPSGMVGTGSDKVRDGGPRVATHDQRFAHQYRVGAFAEAEQGAAAPTADAVRRPRWRGLPCPQGAGAVTWRSPGRVWRIGRW